MKKLRKTWCHSGQVDVTSLQHAKPLLLIGQDQCDLIIAREVIEGPSKGGNGSDRISSNPIRSDNPIVLSDRNRIGSPQIRSDPITIR